MRSRWLISVPAWGDRCVGVCCATTLPALERAALRLQEAVDDVRIIVHTDSPKQVLSAISQVPVDARPVPAGLRDFDCLSQAHRDVLNMACRRDVVVLLTADLVISTDGLTYCAKALANPQKNLVLCATVRAREEGRLPNDLSGPALAKWAWDNRHQITIDCTYPHGASGDLSRLFFPDDGSVCTRQALPHPLAIRMDGRKLRFTPTIDANLMQNFGTSELHYAQNTTELALVELSPNDKGGRTCDKEVREHLANAGRLSDTIQRWCAAQPVSWLGPKVDCGAAAAMSRMLRDK